MPGPAGVPDEGPADTDLTRREQLRLKTGWVGFDEQALYIEEDGERTKVKFENVSEIAFRDTDWFMVVISLTLIGFGLWFVRQSPASLLFSLAGIGSLYILYRQRNELVVRASGRAKPLTVHPEEPGAFYDALGETMGGEEVSSRETLWGS